MTAVVQREDAPYEPRTDEDFDFVMPIDEHRQRRMKRAAPDVARSPFQFLDDVELEELPPPTWRVGDHVPEGGFIVVYAPPESLKTFFSLALALSVATGENFFGREVKRGLVVYVASEGSSGLALRVGAWKHSNEWYERAGVFFLTEPVQLLETTAVTAFLLALDSLEEEPALIVFDTLHRCMAGGDENSAKDMGVAIQSIDTIRRATNAAILVVHHTRKDGDAERGSTSLRGAADTMIALKREDDQLTVSCEKMKDSPHFPSYSLELIRVEESCAFITAKNHAAVSHLMPGDPRHRALSILHECSLANGLTASDWEKAVKPMPQRTFYASRKFLVINDYVSCARPGRGARYVITEKGIEAVTANCNLTAKVTAKQSAAITASGAHSLREPAAMQCGAQAV